MDKSAAGQYMDRLFGTRQGHVAVAYKDKGQSWQECQFAWPAERGKLLGWAEVHQDANVFICPALRRDAHTRKKGDMHPSSWLWADVDWQSVPADRQDQVRQRIKDLGTLVVLSGSGNNAHVYVQLDKPVDHAEFIKLNTGLRDYLYADNKQADNSLLRLPGTTNWKTDAGSPVTEQGGNGKRKAAANLMTLRTFKDARVPVDVDAQEWSFIEVEGLSRRLKAKVNMSVEEAEGRYGNRHKAVRATVGDLYKAGMGPDEIHSLMDKYPPALSKAADENGYDVHLDVDRCLARIAQNEAENADAVEEAVDEAFEEMSVEQMTEALIAEGVEKELLRRQIRKMADMAEAERGWIEPPASVSRSLTDALSVPAEPEPYLIQDMAPARGNIVLTAQYKSGKTDLLMGSLARSLADGVPFLDKFEVFTPEGGIKVGHWNLEMDEAHLIDGYIRPSGYHTTDNLVIASLRGYRVNILSDVGRRWTVQWLKANCVKVWTIDSIAQLARMAGVGENSNEDMAQLLGTIDEIKTEAGVETCFLIAHTGRAEQEQGKERARAATVIDDWPDSRWVMTVDSSDIRFLQVQGRGTAMNATSLDYDPETHRYTLGGQTRQSVASEGWVQAVVGIVQGFAEKGISEASLWAKMKEIRAIGKPTAVEHILEAVDGGFIDRKRVPSPRGGKAAWMHFPAGSLKGETRAHGATPAEVDLRNVGAGRKRRLT